MLHFTVIPRDPFSVTERNSSHNVVERSRKTSNWCDAEPASVTCVSVCLCDSIQGHSNKSLCRGCFSPGSDFPLQAGVAPLFWEPCLLFVSETLGAALFLVLRLPGASECPPVYVYPKAHGLPCSSSYSARFLQRSHLYSRLFCHFLNHF